MVRIQVKDAGDGKQVLTPLKFLVSATVLQIAIPHALDPLELTLT